MRVGVISDTHLELHDPRTDELLRHCRRLFGDVAVILHAGDIVDPLLLSRFPQQVLAVRGNLDPPELPLKRVVTLLGKRIGLIHGWGAVNGLEARVLREFAGDAVDCIVFGHSHQPVCHQVANILLFNPGSPTERRNAPVATLGILEIGAGIRGVHLPLAGF